VSFWGVVPGLQIANQLFFQLCLFHIRYWGLILQILTAFVVDDQHIALILRFAPPYHFVGSSSFAQN